LILPLSSLSVVFQVDISRIPTNIAVKVFGLSYIGRSQNFFELSSCTPFFRNFNSFLRPISQILIPPRSSLSVVFQVDISRIPTNIAVKKRFIILFNIKLGLDKAERPTS